MIPTETNAGAHLPYRAHLDDFTLLLSGGRLLQTLKLNGLLFETAETNELNYRKLLRDTGLRAIGSSQFAVYHHVLRRRVSPGIDGSFPDRFSSNLDARWTSKLRQKELFGNEIFLSVLRRPLQGGRRFADRLARSLFSSSEMMEREIDADRRALTAVRESLTATYAAYGARALRVYDIDGELYSEPLEFLSTLVNGTHRPVKLPYGDLSQYVPDRRLSFGRRVVEIEPHGRTPRTFVAMLSIKDYPGGSAAGMMDALLRLPIELSLSQSFAFVDRQAALGKINLVLRRMRASDDEAISLRDELALARDDVAAGRAGFGEHHLTVEIRAETTDRLDAGVAEVQAALTDLGLISVREDLGLEAAFWAQFPGNTDYIARRALISSRNFASFASSHNFAIGKKEENHWGHAVSILETTASGPYFFNFHQGDLGNFTVIGPSGSGKTVVLNFLLAQSLRFDPKIIFFDKDRGAEIFLRAIEGRYDVLRPGEASGFNPLRLNDTPENRHFLIDWISVLVSKGAPLAPQDEERIEDAINANFSAPISLRRLSAFAELLRGGDRPRADDLYARLRPWWGEGEHAWLFDNAEDLTDVSARIIGFDMTRLLDDPVTRSPAMMYLFHQVEARLDGTPTIIVVDEGWKALDDAIFVERLKDWEKTIRKRNGLVGFATQSAEDALRSKIASSVVEQAATQIFMPNSKAQESDYVRGFGLTTHEFELIRTLPDSSHCFLIKHGKDSVIARLDLRGESELLTVLSGQERTVRLLDQIRKTTGDRPEAWMPQLLEQT